MSCGSTKRGYDQGGCVRGGGWPPSPAYNVEPVTNTSSSSCANNGRRGECSTPFVAALFFTLRDSYVWQHSRSVCSEARYSSRIAFFCLPHLHSTSQFREVPVGISHPVWYGKTRMVWLPDSEKISKICLFVLTWSTNVTDRRTDIACRHGRAYASHRAAKIN